MKLSEESRRKIIKAYTEVGDAYWLDVIGAEIEGHNDKNLEDILLLLKTLYKMNYIIMETETEEYAGKYYTQAHELYAEMKVDLTEMLGIEDMWEEI